MITFKELFAKTYNVAQNKVNLKLWNVDFAKGYLYCLLDTNNIDSDLYDELSTKIDNLEIQKKKLTSHNVEDIFVKCLTNTNNINCVECTAITHTFVFDKNKIKEHKEEILDLLLNLPKEFRESEGGGYSFLAACDDINHNQWTGLHINMEKLFALGMTADLVECLMPREMWSILPGGMPYYMIKGV